MWRGVCVFRAHWEGKNRHEFLLWTLLRKALKCAVLRLRRYLLIQGARVQSRKRTGLEQDVVLIESWFLIVEMLPSKA